MDGVTIWHSYAAPLLVEFYGTFFLTVVASMVGARVITQEYANGQNVAFLKTAANTPELAVGMALALLVYSGGHISGGHYNPAVTIGVLLRGKIDVVMGLLYWVVQFLGGMTGACVGTYLTGEMAYPLVDDVGQACAMSIMFTFLLVQTVLTVATSKAILGNQFFGLCIGMAVFVFASCTGTIPGSNVNPAVATGTHFAAWTMQNSEITAFYLGASGEKIEQTYNGQYYWVNLVMPLIGGMLAAGWYRLTSPREFKTKKYGRPQQGHVHQDLNSSKIADVLKPREDEYDDDAGANETENQHLRA